jgi:hypothetical protein
MAAGGDFGASVVPQLVGIITDTAVENAAWAAFADGLGFTPEQFGMKIGLLVGMLFPLVAIPIYLYFLKTEEKK